MIHSNETPCRWQSRSKTSVLVLYSCPLEFRSTTTTTARIADRDLAQLFLAVTSAISLWFGASTVALLASVSVAVYLARKEDGYDQRKKKKRCMIKWERRFAEMSLVVGLIAWTLAMVVAELIEEGQAMVQLFVRVVAETIQVSWAFVVLLGLIVARARLPHVGTVCCRSRRMENRSIFNLEEQRCCRCV